MEGKQRRCEDSGSDGARKEEVEVMEMNEWM